MQPFGTIAAARLPRLLRIVVCVCLLIEPLLVPLHLASADHSFGPMAPGSGGDAIYGMGHSYGHGHAHLHSHEKSDKHGKSDSDAPHPAEEHLCKADQPGTPARAEVLTACEPSTHCVEFGISVHAEPLPRNDSVLPLKPPPRTLPTPRAPPVQI